MAKARNVLFIMFDQLRWDYLGCYGHPHLKTPNIDRLASRGVRFDRAYIQAPICGASRMSTYTGRYVNSHGAGWNNVPLRVGEPTMGDHLRAAGMSCWLVGKTHMAADTEGMARLGLSRGTTIGDRVAECGFDVWERDDGMRPEGPDGFYDDGGALAYNAYLRERGYAGDNPWHDHANSAVDDAGNVLSGWFLENNNRPANIAEEDSETPYMMRRGMAFIEQAAGPWCCHLSLIKPHWPYIVPEPYASMYGPQDCLPVVRTQEEFDTAHPVLKAMMQSPVSRTFSRDDARMAMLPAYMGLIKQIDDQVGVLLDWLEATGRMDDTMIVLTSDHGDFLGDHWLGEKQFFHDTSTRVPLIVYDPSPEADATRGTASDALVEQIDVVPTFYAVAGGDPGDISHVVEGHSLLPILHGNRTEQPREIAICEYDYSSTPLRKRLSVPAEDARAFMAAGKRWKLIHFEGGFRPMLFDLQDDPQELVDLGESPDHQAVIAEMYGHLNAWFRRCDQRITRSRRALEAMGGAIGRRGVTIGVYSEREADPDLVVRYVGRKARPWQEIVKSDTTA
ncbi:MAG: sulfatase-like hydrolase/transferase [Rhodobacteraceae bacterium]|nr:sulfatase-like hydrolase/transferase [Paracoccaceae bacterium]